MEQREEKRFYTLTEIYPASWPFEPTTHLVFFENEADVETFLLQERGLVLVRDFCESDNALECVRNGIAYSVRANHFWRPENEG